MNEKVTLQALAEQLASRHQMEQADAEAFVQTFVALIEEALQQEKYVKVKGLGTFKLIEMSGHNRVSFVPEASLRDLINKPFAHFETVVLNENTHFDDMTEEVLSTDNLSESEEQTEVVEPKAVSDTEIADFSAQPVGEEDTTPEHAESSEHKETTECTDDESVLVKEEETPVTPEVPQLEKESEESKETFGETVSEKPEVQVNRRISRIPWCMIATVLLAGVLIGGGIVWALLSGRRYIPESLVNYWMKEHVSVDSLHPAAQPVKDTVVLQPDTIAVVATDTVQKVYSEPEQPVKVPARRETLADTVDYDIQGTQTTHTIQRGESLAKISLKYYGTKKLWPYLVRHNKKIIKNPNNVPIGTVIQIPVLVPAQE
ncbi:dNA-binding protein HU [Phocaeicola coprophilus CAG:333]|uniref:HU family DNA-binding protein n=1 Tax=Phocaeicola coprophilus TaxID=387090 RepID=UPI00033DDCA0|nr:HU family DNA-binding protein [Phocaeicola coprophilus]CDC56462.1 dNA-binding protein HU [Phocaeicola coprophilus CAG:333]